MFRFDRGYFVLTALIFLIEVWIALYVRDRFVRPYFGDVLVVILLYCFIRSFLSWRVWRVTVGVLLFAFLIEFLQYLNIVDRLGLSDSIIASTVIGTSFAWHDMLAYVAGAMLVAVGEYLRRRQVRL